MRLRPSRVFPSRRPAVDPEADDITNADRPTGSVLPAQRASAADGGGGVGEQRSRSTSRRTGRRFVADFAGHVWGVAHAGALVLGVVGVLVLGAVLLASNTSLLGVRHIQVRGAEEVAQSAIIEASGLTVGVPMTGVDGEAVTRGVLTLPGLETASVDRVWPTTVRITVAERVPVLAVETSAGLVLVDRKGVTFDGAVELPDNLLLFIPPDRDAEGAASSAAKAVAALPPELRGLVDTVSATSAKDVRLTLTDGREVIWGDGDDGARKSEVLQSLLGGVEGGTYDVSVPEVALVL